MRLVLVAAAAGLGLCASAAFGATAPDASVLTKHVISVPGIPDALCNDGSPPVFYYQAGTGDDRNKWVILFQDGGGCTSDAACTTRARGNSYFTSSTGPDVPATAAGEGILSRDPAINPDFADYNHVLLHYCSSDGYAGNSSRVIDGVTWQFRGAEIVDALVEQLATQPTDGGPTLATASDVLVAGSSSGAMGVHNNLDRIAARLAPVKVRGLADSGWVPTGTIPFALGTTYGARPDQSAAYAYFNARADDSCVVANPKNPGACLGEAFAFPYLATPMFVYADQRDTNILGMLGIPASPTSEDQGDYVMDFAAAVRDTLRATAPAYFAANVTVHDILLWEPFWRIQASETETFGATFHAWYTGEPGEVRVVAPGPGAALLTLTP